MSVVFDWSYWHDGGPSKSKVVMTNDGYSDGMYHLRIDVSDPTDHGRIIAFVGAMFKHNRTTDRNTRTDGRRRVFRMSVDGADADLLDHYDDLTRESGCHDGCTVTLFPMGWAGATDPLIQTGKIEHWLGATEIEKVTFSDLITTTRRDEYVEDLIREVCRRAHPEGT